MAPDTFWLLTISELILSLLAASIVRRHFRISDCFNEKTLERAMVDLFAERFLLSVTRQDDKSRVLVNTELFWNDFIMLFDDEELCASSEFERDGFEQC